MQHVSTHDLLIIQRYSKLLTESLLENEVLREELAKSKRFEELYINSDQRWKIKYENLLKEMGDVIELRRNLK